MGRTIRPSLRRGVRERQYPRTKCPGDNLRGGGGGGEGEGNSPATLAGRAWSVASLAA